MTGSVAAHGIKINLIEGQDVFANLRKGEAIAGANASRVFCIKLLSGIIGVL